MDIGSIMLFSGRNIPLLLSVVLCAGGRVQCPVQGTLLCIEIWEHSIAFECCPLCRWPGAVSSARNIIMYRDLSGPGG